MPRSAALRLLAFLALSGAAGCCLEITGVSTGDITGADVGTSAGIGTSAGTDSSTGPAGASTGSSSGGGGTSNGSSSGAGCLGDNRWIYVVDGTTAMLARFDPAALTFTNIGALDCPVAPGDLPESMAVDRNGVAWVSYFSGNLFQADTADADCMTTDFVPSPMTAQYWWGMSFLSSAEGGPETLYIDEPASATTSELAIMKMPSLVLDPISTVRMSSAELAETDHGELWAYSWLTEDNVGTSGSELAQLDPATGSILQSTAYLGISIDEGFAMKFWKGSFWIFIGSDVYQVPRDTLVPSLVISSDGYDVIGAGVANCLSP